MKRTILQTILFLSLFLHSEGQEVTKSGFKELRGERLTLPDATVASESQASQIAMKAFTAATSGLSATESFPVDYIVRLGFNLPEFGRKGDKVWQVRVWDMANGTTGLIWVHADTGNARILISR